MKKSLRFIGFVFLGLIALVNIACTTSGDESSTTTELARTTEITEPIVPAGPTKEEITKATEQLKAVKKSFNYKEDEFSKAGWYTHKIWRNGLSKPGLMVHVNKDGWAYLSSYYEADDWLFHSSITVKIGDQVLNSEEIPSYDDNNVTDHSGGTIWETVSYLQDKDNGILPAIAANPGKIIKVRFNGDKYYHDITLTKTEKAAIAECIKLASLLEFTQQKGR